jgi:hypothetical protein
MHHLRHGQSLQTEIVTVLDGGVADLVARRGAGTQGVDQLIEKGRHAVIDCGSRRRDGSQCDLGAAARDDLGA